MSITSSAVLVEMNISVWTANKLDRAVTDDVLVRKHAVSGGGQFRKNLMAGTSARKDIADYAAGIRLWHNVRTLPWADKGVRMLPTSLFMEYKQDMNFRRDTFNSMVATFIDDYPNLIGVANNYLGDLFDADDYPDAEEVRNMFGLRLVFSPVPEAGDFRLDIPQQDLDEIKDEYEGNFNTRLGEAMKEPWNRLHKVLSGMSSKLEDSDNESAPKKRYHESLITNAVDLCDMLRHLNITQDPKLEDARKQLVAAMKGKDIDSLKEDAMSRRDLKADVDSMLKQFEW